MNEIQDRKVEMWLYRWLNKLKINGKPYSGKEKKMTELNAHKKKSLRNGTRLIIRDWR